MLMDAYFDESGTHDGSPVVCVAGYLFTAEQSLRLDQEWRDALNAFGIECFHAADSAHGVGEFSNLNRGQRTDLYTRLIGIIKRRMTLGIAVSASENDFGTTPSIKWTQGSAYVFCAMQVVAGVSAWVRRRDYQGSIAYFFENGHRHESLTHAAINNLASTRQYLRMSSLTFASKPAVRPLQTADLLAYEWQKELKRVSLPHERGRFVRRSLRSLLDSPHITQHYTRRELLALHNEADFNEVLREKLRNFTLID